MLVYLGLGSNLGDRASHLEEAVRALGELGRVVRRSNIMETEPWGLLDQPRFLNMVVALETALPPLKLLEGTQEIERRVGRTPTVRWGPRVIDIDILTYGDEVIRVTGLTVPHPRIGERDFVLIPLRQIAPDVADRFDVHG
ncbi:MAG TPA: 2-amino-4-hydroxy-6-hydroxymethyldihydropteridine diphosphokinase [Armatimonadota bacterium]